MKMRNEPKAMPEVKVTEGFWIISSTGIEPVGFETDFFFQKLWLYPYKAVGSGATGGEMTPNGANIRLGKSGLGGGTVYLPDILAPNDLPIVYEMPLGQKMALRNVLIKGTVGDGVFYQFT